MRRCPEAERARHIYKLEVYWDLNIWSEEVSLARDVSRCQAPKAL